MRVAICDDEKNIGNLIKKYIEVYCEDRKIDLESTVYTSGLKLIQDFKDYDIVLLDIEMEDCNGIEIAGEINKLSKNTLVFIVTAYNCYLDDAMDQNVFRYIDKPVDPKRLYKGLDKAMEHIENSEIVFTTQDMVKVRVPKKDVTFVEMLRRKTVIHTVDSSYISPETLEYFKCNLSTSSFVIPHNSYIVNLSYIVEYNRTMFVMKDGSEIPIAQKKQPEIKRKFLDAMRKD